MNAKHTPTPWYADGLDIIDKEGLNVCEVQDNVSAIEDNTAEIDANVSFIVEACNSHEANVARIAELEAALESIKEWCFPSSEEVPTATLNDANARLEWYARRLLIIANASTAALAKGQK